MDRIYHVDLNVTRECQFQCTYCFTDTKGKQEFTEYENFKQFIFKLQNSQFFRDNYDMLCINFWGGEPTIRAAEIVNLINDLNDSYDNIRYFIFSNGYDLHGYLRDFLLAYKNAKVRRHPKVCIQISYDGAPIHNMYRRSNGKLTSKAVVDTIKWLDMNQIPYVIKSTINAEAFKHMYDAYMDIKRLAGELTSTGFYKNVNYFPTIDYYASERLSKDEMVQYSEALEVSLVRIAAEEAKEPKNFFKWFTPNRAICASGQHMVAVDTDEQIYVCHGCLYGDDKVNHLIGNINNDSIIEKLETINKYFGNNIDSERDCIACDVEFCLRCNHAKYKHSEKHRYLDKWRDYINQPNLCKFYQINDKVKKGLDLLREELINI